MPATESHRLDPWIGLIGDLVARPLTVFPYRTLMEQFATSFDAEPSWNWREADGSWGFEMMRGIPRWPPEDQMEFWEREAFARHPLLRWLAVTGSLRPQTIGRVPYALSPRADRDLVRSQLLRLGFDEQLCIPYQLADGHHRSFVLSRSLSDFSDEDVALARDVQLLLALLHRQVQVLSGRSVDPAVVARAGLTGRQLAVLRLLAEGHTSAGIARRLRTSPRTVQKHLEHIYRRLEVRDRLMAVRLAETLGLLHAECTRTESLPVTTVARVRLPGGRALPPSA